MQRHFGRNEAAELSNPARRTPRAQAMWLVRWPSIWPTPFDSSRKRMSVLAQSPSGTALHVKGSVETVLEVATRVATEGAARELDAETRSGSRTKRRGSPNVDFGRGGSQQRVLSAALGPQVHSLPRTGVS